MMELVKESEAQAQAVARKEPESIFNAKGVIQVLEGLMTKVTAQECTPATVNAACNAAARITDLLRVHLEVERLRQKR
jgi:hypothetical protein